MPIKKASAKSWRQIKKRTATRAATLKDLKTVLAQMRRLVQNKKKNEAKTLWPQLQKKLDKNAKRHLLSEQKANRLKSKIARQLAALQE